MEKFVGVEPFNVHSDEENVGTRWTRWLKRFEIYLTAANITDDMRKEAVLLHCAGEAVFDIFCSLPDTSSTSTPGTTAPPKYEQTKAKLNNYFVPRTNEEFEIFKFRQTKQELGQSIEDYYTTLLKLSANCNFTDKNKEIKSQIIQFTTSSSLRRYAMKEQPTLQELITQAKTIELTEKQARQMESQQIARIKTSRFSNNRLPNKQISQQTADNDREKKTCKFCGNDWHRNGLKTCPARNAECHFCKKNGHFSKVCLQKQKHKQETENPSEHRTKQTRQVTTDKIQQNGSDEEHSFTIFVKNIHNANEESPRVTVKVNGKPINFIVDTGSTVNLINSKVFSSLNIPIINKVSLPNIFTYDTNNQLQIIGKFSANFKYKNNQVDADIFVVNGFNYECLLSYHTSKALKLVEIAQNINLKSDDRKINIQYVLEKYPTITKGVGNLISHEVELHIDKSVPPVANKHRRIPFHLREKVEQELNRLEEQGIIEKVQNEATPWVSPIVIVPKKNNTDIRICVDMRAPNKAILRERHITPTIDDIISQLNGATVFSKIDLKDGYHQLTLSNKSRYITTFTTHIGLYHYKRLNFGINAASEIFQNIIRQVLVNIPGVINLSDDILIYGTTKKTHDEALLNVLNRLSENGLTINKNKCIFSTKQIKFFGYVFSNQGIHPDPEKVNSFENLSTPQNASEVRSLLGMLNYVSKFLPNLAKNTEPLRKLTLKKKMFKWTGEHDKIFSLLKQQLNDATKLAYFDINKPTHLYVDAGPTGIGTILSQESNGKTEIVAYSSRTLSNVEQRYSQIERETLAVTWSIQHFHLYLYGSTFILHTDHLPLVRILQNSRSAPSARIERLCLRIQPYQFTVLHQKGESNPSDYLSRHPLNLNFNDNKIEEYTNFIIRNNVPKAINIEEVQSEARKDPSFSLLREALNGNNIQWKNPNLSPYAKIKEELSVVDDLILRGTRIVLPKSLCSRAIELAHKGHQGIVKTKQLLRSKVWFPNMDHLTQNYITNCLACQSVVKTNNRAKIIPSIIPKTPFENIDVDFAGPFYNGKYLFLIVDECSRFPIVTIVNSTKFSAIKPVIENCFCTFGIPKLLKSDNGPPFQGHEFEEFLARYNVKHHRVTPYWPEANGMVERLVKTLKKSLKCALLETNDFTSQINDFLLNYRSTAHTTTGKSPFEIVFKRQVNNFLPMIAKVEISEEIREKDHKNKEKQKRYADQHRKGKEGILEINDLVLCKKEKHHSLSSVYDPKPYKIIDIKGTTIVAEREGRIIKRNISFFKKFFGNVPTNQNTKSQSCDPYQYISKYFSNPVPQNNGNNFNIGSQPNNLQIHNDDPNRHLDDNATESWKAPRQVEIEEVRLNPEFATQLENEIQTDPLRLTPVDDFQDIPSEEPQSNTPSDESQASICSEEMHSPNGDFNQGPFTPSRDSYQASSADEDTYMSRSPPLPRQRTRKLPPYLKDCILNFSNESDEEM